MSIFIIGNGIAATGVIEGLRKGESKEKIYVISEEPYFVYSKPLISYYLVGKIEKSKMYYRPRDFYKKNDVIAILGEKVIEVDFSKQKITTNKNEYFYDKLVITSGGEPVIPKIDGVDGEGVFTFTSWTEIEEIKKYLRENKNIRKVGIIGGGLIGIKAAESFYELGYEVYIFEMAEKILPNAVDKIGSDLIKKHLKDLKIKVFTSCKVSKILRRNGKILGVYLEGEGEISLNLIILATGVRPNLRFLDTSKLKINNGIIVDKYLRTNIENVYAAGDVVEIYDKVLKITRPIPILPNAYEQGYTVGLNLANQKKEYKGAISMNSIQVLELPIISAGLIEVNDKNFNVLKKLNKKEKRYKKVILNNEGKLVGYVFVKEIDRAGIYTNFIKKEYKVNFLKDKLLLSNFGLIHLPKEFREAILSENGKN